MISSYTKNYITAIKQTEKVLKKLKELNKMVNNEDAKFEIKIMTETCEELQKYLKILS